MLAHPLDPAFGILRNLRVLNLSRNKSLGSHIPEDVFQHMKCLESLDLSSCSFTSKVPAQLLRAPVLVSLDVRGNFLDEEDEPPEASPPLHNSLSQPIDVKFSPQREPTAEEILPPKRSKIKERPVRWGTPNERHGLSTLSDHERTVIVGGGKLKRLRFKRCIGLGGHVKLGGAL